MIYAAKNNISGCMVFVRKVKIDNDCKIRTRNMTEKQ